VKTLLSEGIARIIDAAMKQYVSDKDAYNWLLLFVTLLYYCELLCASKQNPAWLRFIEYGWQIVFWPLICIISL